MEKLKAICILVFTGIILFLCGILLIKFLILNIRNTYKFIKKMFSKNISDIYEVLYTIPILAVLLVFFSKFLYINFAKNIILTKCSWLSEFRHLIIGGVLIAVFFISSRGIKRIISTSNKNLYVGEIKYSVGCILISLYIGSLMINTKSVDGIINNITVLITALFFIVDGMDQFNEYIKEVDDIKHICFSSNKQNTFYIKNEYILRKIINVKKHCLGFFLVFMYSILIICCNFISDQQNKLVLICMGIAILICLMFLISLYPFNQIFTDFLIYDYQYLYNDVNKMKLKLLRDMSKSKRRRSFFRNSMCKYFFGRKLYKKIKNIFRKLNVRRIVIKYIVGKIFEEVAIEEIKSSRYSSEKITYYYNEFLKCKYNHIILNDLKNKNIITWWKIITNRDENNDVGHAFILNKDNNTYIFVYISDAQRGKGFGTTVMKILQSKNVKNKNNTYIQIADNIKNKEMVTTMLNENGYKDVSKYT